jgi:hypothetical protein
MPQTVRYKKPKKLEVGGTTAPRLIRSFSIDPNVLKKLGSAADNKGTSINALVNSILEQYVQHDLESESHGHISLSSKVFKEMLTEMDEATLIAMARKLGPDMGEETIMYNSLPMNFDTFLKLVRGLLCTHAKWASCKDSAKGNMIMLWHKLGKKWSVFLAEYLRAALPEFVGKYNIPEDMVKVSEEYVAIVIPDHF